MDANTLRKYARILGITPALVDHDRKVRAYSADDLRIISERYANDTRKRHHAPRPFPASVDAPSADAYADLQRMIRELSARLARLEAERASAVRPPLPAPASPLTAFSVRPTPTLRHRLGELPQGMMSRTDVADRHHFPRTTLRAWCESGRIETSPETYDGEYGQFPVAQPVTARGLAQFYTLAIRRRDFHPCPECPHEEAAHPPEPLEE
jgi:hypothetical protein